MPGSLLDVRAKLGQAERHFKVAARLIRHFVRNECGARAEQSRETGLTNVVINLPKPPTIVNLLVGDCIHNMRAALDHLVYEVIGRNPDRPPGAPDDKTQFPICDTSQGFQRQLERGRMRGAPAGAIEEIKALQPYNRRNATPDHTQHVLWVLNRLENIDKHRRLALTAGVAFQSYMEITDGRGGESTVLAHETLHDGAVIWNYRTPQPGEPEIEVKGHILAFVAFNEPEELPALVDTDVGNVLGHTLRFIRDKVVPAFDRFA